MSEELFAIAKLVERRGDELSAKADEAEKNRSPNVITLLFAATEVFKIADMIKERASLSPSLESPQP